MKRFVTCLMISDEQLKRLGSVLDFEARDRVTEQAKERFLAANLEEADWTLRGSKGTLTVKFESSEDLSFCRLEAEDPVFEPAFEILKQAYLDSGGDPSLFKDDSNVWSDAPELTVGSPT